MSTQRTLGRGFEQYIKTTRCEQFLGEIDRVVLRGDPGALNVHDANYLDALPHGEVDGAAPFMLAPPAVAPPAACHGRVRLARRRKAGDAAAGLTRVPARRNSPA